jgi:uroporphyrin-III C-methyltransferase
MKLGMVHIVGAGPGDPKLITVRGWELLHSAQVIVHDHLVDPAFLDEAASQAIKIFAGKRAGRHCATQDEINRVLIAYSRAGYEVVRLKGGDPFVFGRGGEEAEALSEAGIPFEIVPGVSSAIAVPAYAGIPLTHRKFASSFAVVTGHEACKSTSSVNWAKLATAVDTLIVLMGLGNLAMIVQKLIDHGRSPQTPVAVIHSGATINQESVVGTLADIVEKCALIETPALIVIGDVVSLADKLHWFKARLEYRLGYDFAHTSELVRA